MALVQIQVAQAQAQDGLDFIAGQLKALGVSKREASRSLLIAEESIGRLVAHASDKDAPLDIAVRRGLRGVVVKVALQGDEFKFAAAVDVDDIIASVQGPSDDSAVEAMLQDMLLHANGEHLRYRHVGKTNQVSIRASKVRHSAATYALLALVAAVVVGLVLKVLAPKALVDALASNVFSPVSTVFLSILKALVCPVIFFSLMSCVSQFASVAEVGRIGGKVVVIRILSSVIACLVGVGVFALLQPGNPMTPTALDSRADLTGVISGASEYVTIKDQLIDIVPSNIVDAFLTSDMEQIAFIALVLGLSLGSLGSRVRILRNVVEACNALFLKVTVITVRFIPLVTFCSIVDIVLEMGWSVLGSILELTVAYALGILAMLTLYCLTLVVAGRLSPLRFLAKYASCMARIFSMGSSCAAIPINMDACERKLGVPKKVCSLSVLLGATINADATCIYLMLTALVLAHIFGIDVTGGQIASMVVASVVISVGSSTVPGTGLVCLSVLLAHVGVPLEAVSLVIGIGPLLAMMRTMSDCTGDVVASVVIAKMEGLLDVGRFKDKGAGK